MTDPHGSVHIPSMHPTRPVTEVPEHGARPARGTTPTTVLFLTPSIRDGGAGRSLYYFLMHVDRSRIHPIVAAPDGEGFADLDVEVIVPPRLHHREDQQRFHINNPLTLAASVVWNLADHSRVVPWIARLSRRRRVSAIYCNSYMVEPIGALAALLADIPCVLHARNIHESPIRAMAFSAVGALPSVRAILANSAATGACYLGPAKRRVQVLHNGVELSEYQRDRVASGTLRAELGIDLEAPVVGFTGNIIPRKGIDTLVRAMARVVKRLPRAMLVVVGQVPVQMAVDYRLQYQRLAAELGIEKNVVFAGFRLDVKPYLADFDVLTLPSRQEPFGRSIIEAMALGVPVVSTRVGGVAEIIRDGVDGLLVPRDDDVALAAALERLLLDPRTRSQLAKSARARVEEHFDARRVSERIEQVLLQVAN